jgi:preprotein translocase subunit YajC
MELASLLPLAGIFLVFWLLVIRPASRCNKEMARLQAGLEPGDEVMLSSGIYATVRAATKDTVHVEIADGVTVKAARGAVARVVPPDLEEPESVEPESVEPGQSADEQPETGSEER